MSKSKTTSPEKQKILVYGITGLLGSRIKDLLSEKYKIIAPPHSHLNLRNIKEVEKNIKDTMPHQIVYAAGLTKVDYCQLHKKEAFDLNYKAVKSIAQEADIFKIPVHYISTDAVFDGKKVQKPYRENDKTNPISVYGKSKLAGEKAVLEASSKNSVIRTIMLYSSSFPHKKDFARLAYDSLKNGEKFVAIEDQVINPTLVDDLVYSIDKILEKKAKGIYHVAATTYTTNYGFAQKIAKAFGFNKNLIVKEKFNVFFKDKPAPRAKFCWLDTTKFKKEFGNNILHNLDESIEIFKKQIEKIGASPLDF